MANFLKTVKKVAAGAAIAGAAGYLAGLLTAPKSGRETREEFRKSAGKGMTEVERQLKSLQTELSDLINEARGKGDDASGKAQKELHKLADKAKDSKDKVKEIL